MVRGSRPPSSPAEGPRGLARHLEGWQPGLLAVFLAGGSAILAVPRPIEPTDIPAPLVAPRALERVARDDAALAAAAVKDPLDVDVRELGRAVRAYGLADADGDDRKIVEARRDLAQAASRARAEGDLPVLRLRAYQLASFQRELRRWEGSGEQTDELREIGGGFVDRARRNGWIEGQRLIMGPAVRAALFKKRWNDLSLSRGDAFELTRDESRALYAFLLAHPPHDADAPVPSDPKARAVMLRAAALAAERFRLQKLEELHRVDPAYPVDLARGVVFYRDGKIVEALASFRRHLEDHPDGPFALRANNYLRAALERAGE